MQKLPKKFTSILKIDTYFLGDDGLDKEYYLVRPGKEFSSFYYWYGEVLVLNKPVTKSSVPIQSMKYRELINKFSSINEPDSPIKRTVLTDEEAWKLAELMYMVDILTESAFILEVGKAGFSACDKVATYPEYSKQIVEEVIPNLFKEIDKVL